MGFVKQGLVFREVQPSDLEFLRSWRNDPVMAAGWRPELFAVPVTARTSGKLRRRVGQIPAAAWAGLTSGRPPLAVMVRWRGTTRPFGRIDLDFLLFGVWGVAQRETC